MVRTRFAPSPTGYLHIGGVRTALFNWLFSRKHGGQFLLRIDDTDAQRNVQEALAPILHGFKWLGIDWDEGPEVGGPHAPYFQSQRAERHKAAAAQLLASGHAYRDYARKDEMEAERKAATEEKRPFRYSRRWEAKTPEDCRRFEAEGREGAVRLRIPDEGKLVLDDLVRGRVEFEWPREADHVVQRADGSCLYHLASVVDDHDFGITHVIRAEEHLPNTPRQVFIAQSLGYPLPQYAHLPYVAEPGSKEKLSKRKLEKYLKNPDFAKLNAHGAAIAEKLGLPMAAETFNPVIVDFYEQVGYLPEAILNYLLLLGWSLDDKTEQFSRQQMIDSFTLERVNKAPASFDPQKLWSVQDRTMQQLTLEEKGAKTLPFLQKAGLLGPSPSADEQVTLRRILTAAGDRIKTSGDILDYADFFTADEALTYDEKTFTARIRKPPEAPELLQAARDRLQACEPFDVPTIEAALHALLEERGLKIGQLVHGMRVAVTGKSVGFGLFETLAILGKERCVRRIDRALAQLA